MAHYPSTSCFPLLLLVIGNIPHRQAPELYYGNDFFQFSFYCDFSFSKYFYNPLSFHTFGCALCRELFHLFPICFLGFFFCLLVNEIYGRVIRVYVLSFNSSTLVGKCSLLLSVILIRSLSPSYPWHSQRKENVIITKTKTEKIGAKSSKFPPDVDGRQIERNLLWCPLIFFYFFQICCYMPVPLSYSISLYLSPMSAKCDGCKGKYL